MAAGLVLTLYLAFLSSSFGDEVGSGQSTGSGVKVIHPEVAKVQKFNAAPSPKLDWKINLERKFDEKFEKIKFKELTMRSVDVRSDYIAIPAHPENQSNSWNLEIESVNGSNGSITPNRVLLYNEHQIGLVSPVLINDTVIYWKNNGYQDDFGVIVGLYASNSSKKWERANIKLDSFRPQGNSIYVQENGLIKKLYPSNGSTKEIITATPIEGTLDRRFENVLFYSEDDEAGGLYINTSNGSYEYFPSSVEMIRNGLLFSSPANLNSKGELSAFYLSNGTKKWSWEEKDIPAVATPLYSQSGYVILNRNETLYAVDTDTGETEWSFSVPVRTVRGMEVTSITVEDLTKKRIYFMSNEKLYSLDIETGNIVWKLRPPAEFPDAANAENGSTYVAYTGRKGGETVLNIESGTGNIKWKTRINSDLKRMIVRREGVFIISYEGIYALNKSNGEVLWKTSRSHQPISFQKNRVYTLKNSTIYALKYSSAS